MWTAVQLEEDGRRQHKTELDGDQWSVAYVLPGATRIKSSQQFFRDLSFEIIF